MNIKRVTSLTILWAFAIMVVTGVVLYIVPHGRVAYWADWHLLGLSKTQWGNLHVTMGLLMLLSGILHIYYNWKPLISYLKDRARRIRVFTLEFNVATALALLFVGLTLAETPPVSWILDASEAIKEQASATYGEPPYGHAEESRLSDFIRHVDLDEEKSLALLAAAGIEIEGRGQIIQEIAAANGCTPQQVYETIKPAGIAPPGSLPAAPPAGLGRLTVAEIGERYGIDLDTLQAAFASLGIEAAGTDTLKFLAESRGSGPKDLYLDVRGYLSSQ